MTKQAAITDLSPLRLIPTAPITLDHHDRVVQQLQHAICFRPRILFSWIGVPYEGYADQSPEACRLYFDGALDTWETRLRGTVELTADDLQINLGVWCIFTTGLTGEVRVSVGAEQVTLLFSDSLVLVTDTIDATLLGAGVHNVTVEMRRTSAEGLCFCQQGTLQCAVVDPTDLPDPDDT